MLTLMECIFESSCSSLTSLSTFLIAHQQVPGHNFASKISLSVLLSEKFLLVEQVLFIQSAWLYGMLFFNDFGYSELMLRKICQKPLPL